MSNRKIAGANLAARLSAAIITRSDRACRSGRRCSGRLPELKAWGASFRVAAICTSVVCVASWGHSSKARGGHMHGMGGFGIHEGHRMGLGAGGGLLTPTYVLITVSRITDAEVFKVAIQGLMAADMPFAGRLAADGDKPVAWEGTAPEHIVIIQFDNPDQAQAWKSSDAFKNFDAELHRSSESAVQLVQGLPMPAARGIGGGRRGHGFDPKAFGPNVKEYDQMLNKMHGICKGC